jgi:hypothetical protein
VTNINVRELNNSMFVYFVISLINVRKWCLWELQILFMKKLKER